MSKKVKEMPQDSEFKGSTHFGFIHFSKLAHATYTLRLIAKNQMIVDKSFFKELYDLKKKLYTKKIGHEKFWKEYKKILSKSLKKNNKTINTLFKEIEKEAKKEQKKAKTEETKPKEPMIDLKLPE